MIGQSLPVYLFLRVVIFAFRSVALVSFVYILFRRLQGQLSGPPSWLGVLDLYAALELAFYLFIYLPRQVYLQKAAVHPTPILDRAAREALFERCRQSVKHDKGYPTQWFIGSDIRRGNLRDWLLWSFFSAKPDQADQEWDEELNAYAAKIEALLGKKLDDGFGEDTRSMRLTFDPVVMLYRPFAWYMIVGGIDFYASMRMHYLGFRHYAPSKWLQVFPPRPWTVLTSNKSVDLHMPYWYREHTSKDKLPILFIHGIGIGFWPYLPFLKELVAQDPEVGILAVEILSVSMHMTAPPLPSEETCIAITRILDSLALPRVVVCSHSYGTVITTHMLHSPALAPRIASILFVDPIPFLLHLPNVAHNFVYRKPYNSTEWVLWYFASRDPDISRALSRHFFWAENILWKEELEDRPGRVAVALSGADQIVHAEAVRKYLTAEEDAKSNWTGDKLEVLFYPTLDHADIFDAAERREPLLDALRRFVQDT